jgi:hypothetical protein
MDQESIRRHIAETYEGVDVQVAGPHDGSPEIAWGDTFFICDPRHELEGARRFPFATIVTKDYGDFDNRSHLDREGVFRLNIGVSKETFDSLFGEQKGHDYAALDTLIPHPVYAEQHWVSILNPSDATYNSLRPLLDEAYAIGLRRAGPRGKSESGSR